MVSIGVSVMETKVSRTLAKRRLKHELYSHNGQFPQEEKLPRKH